MRGRIGRVYPWETVGCYTRPCNTRVHLRLCYKARVSSILLLQAPRPTNTSPREGYLILGFSEPSESDSLVASRRFAMRPGIALRPDYDAARLRGLAKAARDAGQSRRLLALAEIDDGGSRTRAERVGGVGLQTLRGWVGGLNARGPGGFVHGKAPGNARKLNESQRQALVNIVESGPMPAIHGVVRWRLKDLTLWIWEEVQISPSETTLSRELRALGYRKLSARPRHYAQKPEALERFKKVSPATLET